MVRPFGMALGSVWIVLCCVETSFGSVCVAIKWQPDAFGCILVPLAMVLGARKVFNVMVSAVFACCLRCFRENC